MKIGIIGAGKVGCAIALALKNEGIELSGVYSRTEGSAELLNSMLRTQFKNDIIYTVENSDIIFITVSDGQISAVAEEIASVAAGSQIKDSTFIHCSGALPASILMPVEVKGAHVGALHPIQTFADRENGWRALNGIYFGFEGGSCARAVCETIVTVLKGKMLHVKAEDKPIYHAAACILSNYTVALGYIGEKMLQGIGINEDIALKAFAPLIENTVANIISAGSVKALTGPVSRGDYEVVERHVKEIGEKMPEWLESYIVMGRVAVEAAIEKSVTEREKLEKTKKVLIK